jgi:hypothetical protein
MKEEALDYDEGGLDLPNKRERVYALLGPGATAYGIAAVIEPYVNYALDTGTQTVIPTEFIAQAIVEYNKDFIGRPSWDPANLYKSWPAWRVGMRVPLPLEIKSATEWVVDREAITALHLNFSIVRYTRLLSMPPSPLEIPDPAKLEADTKTALPGASIENLAETLAAALLANPYEPVFRALELMRQLRQTRPADELSFALEVLERINDREAKRLGWTTGGAVVLRRLWDSLTKAQGVDDADEDDLKPPRDRIGAALGLKANAAKPGGFESPQETFPTVRPLELPDPVPAGKVEASHAGPHERPTEDSRGMQAMVLGRQVCVGNRAETFQKGDKSTWSGPSYPGRINPVTFAEKHPDAIGTAPGQNPSSELTAALALVLAIAPNEGWLDAVRAADAGMISTGVQQWSAHSNKELAPLLTRFKKLASDHYDAFFGLYGLDARPWAPAPGTGAYGNDMPDDTPDRETKIRTANPDWVTAGGADVDTPYGKAYPRYSSLWNLDPNLPPRPDGSTVPVGRMGLTTFPAKPKDDPRAWFFGARYPRKNKDGTTNEKVVEVGREWAARFRLVSLCSIPYRANQMQFSCYRVRRIFAELPTFEIDGEEYDLTVLASSQFAAACVLDQHINVPEQVKKDIRDAIGRTKEANAHDAGPPKQLREDWLMRFRVNYLADRWTYGKDHRDKTILAKHDAPNGLRSESGTFTTWQ